MAKKVTRGKGAVPAAKKTAGKKTRKTIKPSRKADTKKKSSLKTAAKTPRPAAKMEKPQKAKKPSKAVKTKKVAAKTVKKTGKKVPVRNKGKKVLPEVAKKRGKEITGKKSEKQKQIEIEKQKKSEKKTEKKAGSTKAVKPARSAPRQKQKQREIEKQKEKKTESIKSEKPARPAPGKKEKKTPEQAKKGIKKTRERLKTVVLKKEQPIERPVSKARVKETTRKVAEKTKKVATRKEEKALPEKVAKSAEPKKKSGGRVKAEIQAEKEPKKVRSVKRKKETGNAASEEQEPKTGEKAKVSGPAETEERAPELPLSPAQADTRPPAPLMGLPAEYGENEIAIILVEPRKVFLFWEVREGTLKIFHGDLHIRVYDVTDDDFRNIGVKFCFDISVAERIGSLYLDVLPAREYVADIGILYEDIFITIARSNKVATPRGAVLDEGLLPAELLEGGQRIGY